MAAPNIVNVTSIIGKTVGTGVSTALVSTGVSNPTNSNQVYKINTISCSNITGIAGSGSTTFVDSYLNLSVYKGGTTHYYIAYNVTVPAGSTIIALGKGDNPIYLEEGDAIFAQTGNGLTGAGTTNTLHLLISYEQIS